MQIRLAVYVALVIPFCASGFASDTAGLHKDRARVEATFASCTTEAYKLLGVQVLDRASLQYLEQKHEVIRVCMLRNGFTHNAASLPADAVAVTESLANTKGWGEEELQKRLIIRQTSTRYWR